MSEKLWGMLKLKDREESFSLTETSEMHRDFNHQGKERTFDTPTGKAPVIDGKSLSA